MLTHVSLASSQGSDSEDDGDASVRAQESPYVATAAAAGCCTIKCVVLWRLTHGCCVFAVTRSAALPPNAVAHNAHLLKVTLMDGSPLPLQPQPRYTVRDCVIGLATSMLWCRDSVGLVGLMHVNRLRPVLALVASADGSLNNDS